MAEVKVFVYTHIPQQAIMWRSQLTQMWQVRLDVGAIRFQSGRESMYLGTPSNGRITNNLHGWQSDVRLAAQ
jgi:hypothetical protein